MKTLLYRVRMTVQAVLLLSLATRYGTRRSPLLVAVGGKEQMYGTVIQFSRAAQVLINNLANGSRPVWKAPVLNRHLAMARHT